MNHFTPVAILPATPCSESSMGRILLDLGKITPEDGEHILRLQKEKKLRFGEAARALGLVTDLDVEQVLARQFDYPCLQPGQGNFSSELVAAYHPFSTQVEALRTIRSQLMLRWFATGHNALAVIAVEPGAGSSLLIANLAVVFSQLGERTLLIDANLRDPRQQSIFDLHGRQGLSDVLAGRAELSVISKIDFFVDLSVLQAGTVPPNPQELVGRAAFHSLNAHVVSQFDIVLYDVPAFTLGADATAIAAVAGGAVLLARKNVTTVDGMGSMCKQLASIGVHVVGSVMVDF
ncbi:MAG: chain length determinant protein tyrosine kinase EpsG [Burkholderiaceae bacterium]